MSGCQQTPAGQRTLWRCLVAAGLLLAPRAPAGLLAWDDFESYAAGSSLHGLGGGTGWSGNWVAPSGEVRVAAGVMTGYGQSMSIATSGTNDNLWERTFPAQTDTLYVGLRLRTTGWGAGNFLQIYLNATTGASMGAALSGGVRNVAGSPYYIRIGEPTYTTNSTTAFHQDSAIETVVMRFSKSVPGPASPYDQAAIFVNRADESVADAVYNGNTFGGAALSYLHLRTYTIDAGDWIYLDTLRLATSYASAILAVVPEPGALAFALLAGAFALSRRRRTSLRHG
jgi:hypothetical protein